MSGTVLKVGWVSMGGLAVVAAATAVYLSLAGSPTPTLIERSLAAVVASALCLLLFVLDGGAA